MTIVDITLFNSWSVETATVVDSTYAGDEWLHGQKIVSAVDNSPTDAMRAGGLSKCGN